MSRSANDAVTHVCRLTPLGRGAVAVIGVNGPSAVAVVDQHFLAANGRPLDAQPVGRIVYGRWGCAAGEDLVVCRRAGDEVEIHCHGGYQSGPQILADLERSGCEEIDWRGWLTQQACPLVAEAQVALTEASTLRTATILLDQSQGALRRAIEAVVQELKSENLKSAQQQLEQILQHAPIGLHLTQPWHVVIAGRPNVGKSSLINALVGYERAIVFDQPGTTRDVVSATTAIDGWPVALSDTAGLHSSTESIESAGIELAKKQLETADLIVWVLDGSELEQTELATVANEQAETIGASLNESKTLIIVNKIDLVSDLSQLGPTTITTNATSGEGIEGLLDAIVRSLVPQVPIAGVAVPFTRNQVTALETALEACRKTDCDKALSALQRMLGPSLAV